MSDEVTNDPVGGTVFRGWWVDLISEPTRRQRERAPRCVSRSGVERTQHTLDTDGVCVFCDKRVGPR